MSDRAPQPKPTLVTGLVGVYDADGGLLGEAKYVVGHLLGRAQCALCDITHDHAWRKRTFDTFRVRLGVPFDLVHRNERSPEVEAATRDSLPSVVALTDRGTVPLLDRHALEACGGDVDRFESAVHAAVREHALLLPTS